MQLCLQIELEETDASVSIVEQNKNRNNIFFINML